MQTLLGSMPSVGSLAIAFVAGMALGYLFFGGLWWTVNRLTESDHPALLFAGSFVLRTAVVLAGVAVVSAAQWQRIAACVVGFVAMRMLLTRLWGPGRAPAGIPEAGSRAT